MHTPAYRRSVVGVVMLALVASWLWVASPSSASAESTPVRPTSIASTLVTNYPIPSAALFVATTGSDANPGTAAQPLATLAKAFTKVPAGGTIVVRGGTYRQGVTQAPLAGYESQGTRYTSVPSGVTVQAYPGETVWFDGTDVVTSWQRVSSTHFTTKWETPLFCAAQYYSRPYWDQTFSGPCSINELIGGANGNGDPQMAFRNGQPLREVTSLSQLAADTFYYDQSARVMHIGFDPAGDKVELAKRAQAFAFFRPVNLSLKGIGFRRYATNQMGNATAGAVLFNGGSGVLVERSVFTEMAAGGMHAWASRNMTVRSSVLSNNGANGFGFNGSARAFRTDPTARDNLTIEYSRLDGNNTERFAVDCTAACSAAGSKLGFTAGLTVRYNTFNNNQGGRASGFWCDLDCSGARIYGNEAIGNANHGIVWEVSNDGIIASNLVANNGSYGLFVGSANTKIYNNTVVNNQKPIFIYDDDRGHTSETGPNTVNIEYANNIVSGGTYNSPQVTIQGGSPSKAENTTPEEFIKVADHNSYYRPAGTSRWWLNWLKYSGLNELYQSPDEFARVHGISVGSHHSTDATNPYLTDPAKGDYSAKAGSPVIGSGRPLPTDVAALLGVPAGQKVNRGYLKLAGSGTATATQPGTPAVTAAGQIHAVDAAGDLQYFQGSLDAGMTAMGRRGTGWRGMTALALVELSGDGGRDLLARRGDDDSLWRYHSTATGAVSATGQVGRNWGGMDQIVPVFNLAGGTDQYVVARRASDGALFRYDVTPSGLTNIKHIGQHWGGMRQILGVGDFSGDDRADVLAVRNDGTLWLYQGTAQAGLQSGKQVGQGWGGFVRAFSPGDLDGDGRFDLVGQRQDGVVFGYRNQQGSWGSARQLMSGASGFSLMA